MTWLSSVPILERVLGCACLGMLPWELIEGAGMDRGVMRGADDVDPVAGILNILDLPTSVREVLLKSPTLVLVMAVMRSQLPMTATAIACTFIANLFRGSRKLRAGICCGGACMCA